jgi:hypothetical protein
VGWGFGIRVRGSQRRIEGAESQTTCTLQHTEVEDLRGELKDYSGGHRVIPNYCPIEDLRGELKPP